MKYCDFTDEELIARLRAGDKEVEDFIMRKYIPLVRKCTNAMYLIGGEKEDLIQEGMMGLVKAVRNYSFDKETSFFTVILDDIARRFIFSPRKSTVGESPK